MPLNKLALCAGRQRKPGWKTLDANHNVRPDFVAVLPGLPDAVTRHEWDEIELIHGIEHFPRWEVNQLLTEILEVLKPGGLLVLEQPNLEYACKAFLGLVEKPKRGPRDQWDMWPLYGDPSHRTKLYSHFWGYSPTTLRNLLLEVGFDPAKTVETRAQSHFAFRDFRMESHKPV